MHRRDDASDADYEQLRRHVLGPQIEHPAGRQQPRAPAVQPVVQPLVRDEQRASAPRISVMTWLSEIGQAVARRLRGTPRSPMARLHPKR
jgi:hypothetical protein